MSASKSTKASKAGARNGVDLWKAIKDAEIEDDLNEILAMSDEELDADIRKNGGDPEAISARGVAHAKEMMASRERTAWQVEAIAKLEAFQKLADAQRSTERLPRAEILRRLDVARNDPRFSSPVTVLFRNKTPEASSDEELQGLLEQIELLRKLEEE
jgi:hypothetical protein